MLIEKLKSVFLYIFKDVVCYQILTNYLIAFKDWSKDLKTGAYVVKSLKAQSKIKQFFCYGTKTKQSIVSSNQSVVLVLKVQICEKQFSIFSKHI